MSKYLAQYGKVTGYGSPYWEAGLDVDLKKGDPVYSPKTGRVVYAGQKGGFGNQVVVQTATGTQIMLSHLDGIDVKVGDIVKKNQIVGKGGNTGNVIPGSGGDGSHLDITVKDPQNGLYKAKEVEEYVNKSDYSKMADNIIKGRQRGMTDTEILEVLKNKVPEFSNSIEKARMRYSVDKNITNDRDLTNYLAKKFSGIDNLPIASNPVRNKFLEQGITKDKLAVIGAVNGIDEKTVNQLYENNDIDRFNALLEDNASKPANIYNPDTAPGVSDAFKQLTGSKALEVKAGEVRVRDVMKEMADMLVSGERALGDFFGATLALNSKDYEKLQESWKGLGEMNLKLINAIRKNESEGKDSSRLIRQLKSNLGEDFDITKLAPAIAMNGKQLAGAVIQTGADLLTAGTYSGVKTGMKSFELATKGKIAQNISKELAKKGLSEASDFARNKSLGLISKETIPTVAGQFKATLPNVVKGAGLGYVYDISTKALYNEDDYFTPSIGTGVGAGVPLAGMLGRFSKTAREANKSGVLLEAIEEARNAINPLKSDIRKIEIKKGKDVDDVINFMLQEEVIPEVSPQGKLETTRISDDLRERKKSVDSKLSSILDDVDKKNDLNKIREKVANEIVEQEANATIMEAKLKDLDDFIDAEIERNGNVITDKKMHEIKSGMWDVGYDINRQTKSPVAKKIGRVMKEEIEFNNLDFNVKQMNELSGRYAESISLLDSVHGNALKDGKMGNWFNRVIGGMVFQGALGRLPVVGNFAAFLGQYIGSKYSQFLNDPVRIMTNAIKKAKKAGLGKESDEIIKVFEETLKRKDADWLNNKLKKIFNQPKALPEPQQKIYYQPDKYENLPNKGAKLLSQDEAIEYLNSLLKPETDPARMLPEVATPSRVESIDLPKRSQSSVDKQEIERIQKQKELDSLAKSLKQINQNETKMLPEKAGASRQEAIELPAKSQSTKDAEEIKRIQEKIKKAKTPEQKQMLLSAVGGAYGIEPVKDENGNITGWRFNPEKAAIGLGAGILATKSVKKVGKINDDISKSSNSLIQEAKKYKSAEEFVKAQPTYYHTTKIEKVQNIEKQGFIGDIGEMSKASGGTMEKGVFLYPEKSSAEVFGKNFKNPSIIETKVNGKVYDANTQTRYGWEDDLQTQEIAKDKTIIAKLKKDGYVGVKSTELGTDAIFVFEPSAVKTKSQLTDIWNKANGK